MEILKIKFGEESLQTCAVMLKDVADSRRFDASFSTVGHCQFAYIHTASHHVCHASQHVKEKHPVMSDADVRILVLSRHYWPGLQNDTFAMPEVSRT